MLRVIIDWIVSALLFIVFIYLIAYLSVALLAIIGVYWIGSILWTIMRGLK